MTTCDSIAQLSSSQVTRVKLLGVGIVCGLEVFRDAQCFISITEGVGVTSEGHVICMRDKKLKYYKEYKDPNNYFNGLINCKPGGGPINCTLFELLEHREESAIPIVPQDSQSVDKPFLDDKVVLLYLEHPENRIERILLIDQLDLWKILKCKGILKTYCIETEPREDEDITIFDQEAAGSLAGEEELFNTVHRKYLLDDLFIRRFGYGAIDLSDLYPEHIDEKNLEPKFIFTDADEFFEEYEKIIEEALDNLDKAIDKLHGQFGCLMDACECGDKKEKSEKSPCHPVYSGKMAETGLQMHNVSIFNSYFTAIYKKWSVYKKNKKPVGSIQYFYDFVKDLINTYNELIHELYDLVNDCCPDTEQFPRHLMLGKIKEEVTFQPSIFRQTYKQPPVYNGNADRLQLIRFLHWRMVIMMKCFFIPDWEREDFSDENYMDVLKLENEKILGEDPKLPVRITPGKLFDQLLGAQTIPFYYNLSNSPYSLQYYWDYKSVRHNREDHQESFFAKEVPGYTNLDQVIHPFLYSLDRFPFYRIEGHTGMPAGEALHKIRNLRRKYALSFDVVPITFKNMEELFTQPLDDHEIPVYGLEHVCGVQKGYTFLLLHDGSDENPGKVIADFQVPFMFAIERKKGNVPPPPPPPPPPPADDLKEKREKAMKDWKARLEKINRQITRKTDLKEITSLTEQDKSILKKEVEIDLLEQLVQLTPEDIVTIELIISGTINKSLLEKAVAEAHEIIRTRFGNKIGGITKRDNLKAIHGISEKMEPVLNKAGILSFEQLSMLNDEDILDMAITMNVLPHVVKREWFEEARTLKNK